MSGALWPIPSWVWHDVRSVFFSFSLWVYMWLCTAYIHARFGQALPCAASSLSRATTMDVYD